MSPLIRNLEKQIFLMKFCGNPILFEGKIEATIIFIYILKIITIN